MHRPPARCLVRLSRRSGKAHASTVAYIQHESSTLVGNGLNFRSQLSMDFIRADDLIGVGFGHTFGDLGTNFLDVLFEVHIATECSHDGAKCFAFRVEVTTLNCLTENSHDLRW